MVDLKAYKILKNKKRMTPKRHRKYIINRIKIICFLFLWLSHILDMITTVIGLNLGAVETNQISAALFNLGWWGFILNEVYVLSIFIVVLAFVAILPQLYKKVTYQDAPVSLIAALYIIFTSTVFIGKMTAVINNIFVIISIW